MNNKFKKTILFLTVFWGESANAGGYDPCNDYPINYILWLVALAIVFFSGLFLARLYKLEKNMQTYITLLASSLLLLIAVANIPPIKEYLDVEFHQKLECFSPSIDSTARETTSAKPVEQASEPKFLTRDEFRTQVMNKTQESVIELIGKPDSTSEVAETAYWNYYQKTIDPVTGKLDNSVQLIFMNEPGYKTVEAINFY